MTSKNLPGVPPGDPRTGEQCEKPYWLFFSVLLGEVLDEPEVLPPAEPLVAPLVDPLGEEPEALLLGELLDGGVPDGELLEDEPPEAEPALDGLLGVVALPLLELLEPPLMPDELEPGRLVASPEDEPDVAPPVSAGRSQP